MLVCASYILFALILLPYFHIMTNFWFSSISNLPFLGYLYFPSMFISLINNIYIYIYFGGLRLKPQVIPICSSLVVCLVMDFRYFNS